MTINLFTFVGLFRKSLTTLGHILEKGATHAHGHRIAEADMLQWQLAPDMFPLVRQAQIVINLSREWSARAAALDVPSPFEGNTNVQELRASIEEACAFLSTLDETQFHDREGEMLTLDLGSISPTLPIGQWVSGFATTNVNFHLATAYGILRSHGVPLGKVDLFAGGL